MCIIPVVVIAIGNNLYWDTLACSRHRFVNLALFCAHLLGRPSVTPKGNRG